jgi:hypothetical protein
MNPSNPSRSTVKHTPLNPHKVAAGLAACNTIVTAGTQCAAVQSSPVAKSALGVLQAAAGTGQTALAAKLNAAQTHETAIKTLTINYSTLGDALRSYEASVNVLANGDGSIINAAGLLTRADKPPPAALGTVPELHSKPGKLQSEAILSWPKVAGATSFALQINTTPATPAGPWTALNSGSSRRRVITGPGPASQLLARVAAVAADGTQSPWCNPILVTTK